MAEAPKRLTQAERKAATREALIKTAAEVFAERGFHGASVEEIAERAGFSHGAVYSNFAGKDELFLAVFEDYMATRAKESIEAMADAPQDPGNRAATLADLWMKRLSRDPRDFLLHFEFMVHAGRDAELGEKMGMRQASLRLAIQGFLEAGARDVGLELPMPAPELALIMRALGIGLAIEAINSPDDVSEEVFGEFTRLLFNALAERAEPLAEATVEPEAEPEGQTG